MENPRRSEKGYKFLPARTPSSVISIVIISGSLLAYMKIVPVAIKKNIASRTLFNNIEVTMIAVAIMPNAQYQSGDRSLGKYSGVFQVKIGLTIPKLYHNFFASLPIRHFGGGF